MSVKMTGLEWKTYYSDISLWRGTFSHEDETLIVNGTEYNGDYYAVSNFDIVELSGGRIYKALDTTMEPTYEYLPISMETHFKRWRSERNFVILAVKVSRDKLSTVKLAIKEAGGKIK